MESKNIFLNFRLEIHWDYLLSVFIAFINVDLIFCFWKYKIQNYKLLSEKGNPVVWNGNI